MSSSQMLMLGYNSPVASLFPTSGLVAYYKMENATDYAGVYDCTEENMTYSAGKIANGGTFNGTDGRLIIPFNAAFNTQDRTINLWINITAHTPLSSIVCNYELDTGIFGGYDFRITPTTVGYICTRFSGGIDGVDYPYVLPTGTWKMLTVKTSRDSYLIQVYVDGTEIFWTPYSAYRTANSKGVHIGAFGVFYGSYTDLGRYFNGMLDEIGFWDRALTNQEIQDLYNSGIGITR